MRLTNGEDARENKQEKEARVTGRTERKRGGGDSQGKTAAALQGTSSERQRRQVKGAALESSGPARDKDARTKSEREANITGPQ